MVNKKTIKCFEVETFLIHMLENRRYQGQRIIEAEVLVYPNINIKNFDFIPFEEYVWETRGFSEPFLAKKKKGEVFVFDSRITNDSIAFQVSSDKEKTKKAKDLFETYIAWSKKRFKETLDRVEKSGLFNKPLDHHIDI